MEIDPNIANDIVTHLKDALRHEINFFDTSGVIIASTDPSRVGSGHDGARLAIALKRTVCMDDEHRFRGAKNGVNVPVQFDGEPVAVIGITGERKEVEPFGTVLQKMTEILIREHLDRLSQFNRRALQNSLIAALVYKRRNDAENERLATILGVDFDAPCTVAVIRSSRPHDWLMHQERLASALGDHSDAFPDTLTILTPQEYLMLLPADADGTPEETRIRPVQSLISSATGHPTHCGISGTAPNMHGCRHSYDQAVMAMQWGATISAQDPSAQGSSTITRYDNLDLGLIVPAIGTEQSRELVRRVFDGLTDATVDAFENTFNAYARHNGGINAAADELFLHKNTLQNHLNRIAAATGYNPRNLNDHTVLRLAFLLRRQLRANCVPTGSFGP